VARNEATAEAQYSQAVRDALADGVVDPFDRRVLETTREDLRLSPAAAAQVQSRTIGEMTSVPPTEQGGQVPAAVVLEINDNHFYMEKMGGVLDFRLTNRTGKPVSGIRLAVSCNFLGSHNWGTKLAAGASARHKFQMVPGIAGEFLLDVTFTCQADGQTYGWGAQPTLVVLGRNETPHGLTVILDQHTDMPSAIGCGVSVRNEVKEGFAKGLLHDVNDLLRQPFPDHWTPVALSYDEALANQDGQAGPVAIDYGPGRGETMDAACLMHTGTDGERRTLLVGPSSSPSSAAAPAAAVKLGRDRDKNQIVLRRTPRGPDADALSLQVSGEHASLCLRPDGLFLADCGSLNGTSLNGQEVKGEARVPLDQPSEVDIGKAFRLRLTPFLDDHDGQGGPGGRGTSAAGRYASLGTPDEQWALAEKLRLRSLLIQRLDNLAEKERYLVVYRWMDVGPGTGNEVVLPAACPARRCMRIVRLGGRFWLEDLSGEGCVRVGAATVHPRHACPLWHGATLGCQKVALRLGPYQQVGL
jgi:hypothetical protein